MQLTVRSISMMEIRQLMTFGGCPDIRTMRSVDSGQHIANTLTSTPNSWRMSRSLEPALPMTQPAWLWCISRRSSQSSRRLPPRSITRFCSNHDHNYTILFYYYTDCGLTPAKYSIRRYCSLCVFLVALQIRPWHQLIPGPDLGGPRASHQQGVSHQTPQFLKPCNSIANPFLKSQIRHWAQASHQLNPALVDTCSVLLSIWCSRLVSKNSFK